MFFVSESGHANVEIAVTKIQGRRFPKLLGSVAVKFGEHAKSRRKTLESQKKVLMRFRRLGDFATLKAVRRGVDDQK
jgi:hypothetical protein